MLSAFSFSASAGARVVYRYAASDGRLRVALTFDDGPHPKYTPQILDILAQYSVPATFFAVGENVAAYPEIAKRICREGHELGDHTYHHGRISKMTDEELRCEILSCKEVISRHTGVVPRLFRPPEGIITPAVTAAAKQGGYRTVLWSVDTLDWALNPVSQIVRTVQRKASDGGIILFHDWVAGKSPTPEALRQVIPRLKAEGYEFVTVSQL